MYYKSEVKSHLKKLTINWYGKAVDNQKNCYAWVLQKTKLKYSRIAPEKDYTVLYKAQVASQCDRICHTVML